MFDADWRRCTAKGRYERLLEKYAPDDASRSALQSALRERYGEALRVFDFYASLTTGGDAFAMHLNAWGQLSLDCDVADEDSAACKVGAGLHI